MRESTRSAADFLPEDRSLASMRAAVRVCEGCELFRAATQAVFGEGPPDAPMVLVGEQPGDREDRVGRPFVGPAGLELDRALTEVGLLRERLYVTNAVKHFKWAPRGKRRLHQTPGPREVQACLPWLDAEIAGIRPRVVVALGATAARALYGDDFRVTTQRGRLFSSPWGERCLATVHPSAVIRVSDPDERALARAAFTGDLAVAAAALRALERAGSAAT